jgi:hypothetical protein
MVDVRGGNLSRRFFMGFTDITSPTNERSMLASIIPAVGVGHTMPLMLTSQTPAVEGILHASLNSFVFDYVGRQKLGGLHYTYFIVKQLAALSPDRYSGQCPWSDAAGTFENWLLPRVLELTYTAWDLEPFAQDCGWSGPPFRWDGDRRFELRCELDAAFFHLYLPADTNGDWLPAEHETADDLVLLKASFPTPRAAVAYIMDTFPIVRRRDEETWGEYRTKRVILEIYDAMAETVRTGIPYRTRLAPPPADPSCRHPKKKIGILAFGSLIKDPGAELLPKIGMRITTQTPFPVEYGRLSGKTRGGAPTLVPHESGAPVSAEILVLDDDVSSEEARNMLWRRERRQEGTGETYSRGTGDNCVVVEEFHDDPCVATVLYTDFNPSGKIPHPTVADLAKKAIASVAAAPAGMDGITYLMNAIRSGIETPLTADYKAEILKQTVTLTLDDALKEVKERQ